MAKQKLKAKNLKRSLIFQTKFLIVLILIIGVRGCNELKNVDGNSMSSTIGSGRATENADARRSSNYNGDLVGLLDTHWGEIEREESW